MKRFLPKGKTLSLLLRIGFILLSLILIIFFVRHEKAEIVHVQKALSEANPWFLLFGLVMALVYILLQGGMNYYSFSAIRHSISFRHGTKLFLRRNFISAFIPGGNLTSQAFFTKELEARNISKTEIHFASTIYILSGFVTILLIALPAVIILSIRGGMQRYEIIAFVVAIALTVFIALAFYSLLKNGLSYKLLQKHLPEYALVFDEIMTKKFNAWSFAKVILCSIGIEITGMIHLWISARTIGVELTPLVAFIGYVVVVVMLMASPLLKGVGPVELILTLVLQQFGFSAVNALSITLIFRFFEFLLPLLAGLLGFFSKSGNMLYRVSPPLFILGLGLVNILSVLTPPIRDRLHLLHDFLPTEVIQGSNMVVIITGIILIMLAASLFKGYRNAWIGTLFLTAISLVANLTKAIDYEEAAFAFITAGILVMTRKQYTLKSNKKFILLGIQTAVLTVIVAFIYGLIGFYILDKKHFHQDFSFQQSALATFENFLLMNNSGLIPLTRFGREFIVTINVAGTLSLGFLLVTLILPVFKREKSEESYFGLAEDIVKNHGNSALDYFKTYFDKSLFFTENQEAFISYKVSNDYAIVLEDPVAPDEKTKKKAILEFENYCQENNLNSVYFRVPEESLGIYTELKKRPILLGQEAIVDITNFSLDGGARKGLRNSVNKMEKEGFFYKVYEPPIKDGLLQKLKYVSDEWLRDGKEESAFSQGIFLWNELKKQTILTAENEDEKIVAFINLIPDYAKGEGTYDLQRRLSDSPNGVLEYLQIKLFQYFREQGFQSINLGLVPMSGMENATHPAERTIRFLYEQLPQFAHYKGLRFYKEKFDPVWVNKYLVYNHSFDLLMIPSAINKVMKT
ncbi:MAG: phosphatidylglycerol lysyltransferase domain-containing protein [Bacteroidota bacterium]